MPRLSESASPKGANSLSQSKSNQSNLSSPSTVSKPSQSLNYNSGLSTAFKEQITAASSTSSGYASSESRSGHSDLSALNAASSTSSGYASSESRSGHSDLSALNASSSSSMTSLTSSLSSSGILPAERVPSTSIAPVSRTNEPTRGSSINDEDDSSIVPETNTSTYQSSTTTRPPSGSMRTPPSQLPPPDFSILNSSSSQRPSNRGSGFGFEQFAAAQNDLDAALESSSTTPSQTPRNTLTASPKNAAAVKTSNKTASKTSKSSISKSSTKLVSNRAKTTVKSQQQREQLQQLQQIQQTFGRIGKHSIIKMRFEIFRVISYYRYIKARNKYRCSSIKTSASSPSEGPPQSENVKEEKPKSAKEEKPQPPGPEAESRTPADESRTVPEAETKAGEEGDYVDAERDRSMEESKGVEPRDPLQSSLEQCEIDKQTTSSELTQNSDSLKPQKRKYPENDLFSALNSALPHDSAPSKQSSTEHNLAQLSRNPCELEFVSLSLPFGVLSEYGFHLRSSDELSDSSKQGITVECTYCSVQAQINEWNSHTKPSMKEFDKKFSDQHLRSLHHPECMWNRTGAELRRSEPGRNIQWLWNVREVPQFGKEKLADSTTNWLFFPLAATNMWSSLQEPTKTENAYLPEEPPERRTFEDWSLFYLKTYYKRNGVIVQLRRERPADAGRPPPQARSATSRPAHNPNLGTIREQDEAESAHGLGAAGRFGARSAGSGPSSSTGANLRGLPSTATATASRSRRNDFSFALEKTRRCKLHHFRSGYRYLVQSMAQSGMSPEHNLPPPPIIQNRSQASMQMKEVRFERSSIRDDPRKNVNISTLSRYGMFDSTIFKRINANFTFLLARAGFYPYIPGVTTSVKNDLLRPGEMPPPEGDGFDEEPGGANNQASSAAPVAGQPQGASQANRSQLAPNSGLANPLQQMLSTLNNSLGLPTAALPRPRLVPYPRPPGRLLEPLPPDTVVCAFCKRFFWNWFSPTEIKFDPKVNNAPDFDGTEARYSYELQLAALLRRHARLSYTCPMTLGVCRDDVPPTKSQYLQLEQALGFRSTSASRDASRGGIVIPSGELFDQTQVCKVPNPAEDDLVAYYQHWNNKRARREPHAEPLELPVEVTLEADFECLENFAAQLEYEPLSEFPQLDPLAGDCIDAVDWRFVVPNMDRREQLETGLGIALDLLAYPPRRPELTNSLHREDTFGPVAGLFPAHRNTLTPQVSLRHLAEAGFYYSPDEDVKVASKTSAPCKSKLELHDVCLRCFFCRLRLSNWIVSDDPWEAHAFWSPGCPFVLRVRGHSFVHRVHFDFRYAFTPPTSAANPFGASFSFEQYRNNALLREFSQRVIERYSNAYDPVGAPQPSQTEFRLQASELRARIDNSPAFLATKKFSYHPLLVSFAIECRFREMGDDYPSHCHFLQTLWAIDRLYTLAKDAGQQDPHEFIARNNRRRQLEREQIRSLMRQRLRASPEEAKQLTGGQAFEKLTFSLEECTPKGQQFERPTGGMGAAAAAAAAGGPRKHRNADDIWLKYLATLHPNVRAQLESAEDDEEEVSLEYVCPICQVSQSEVSLIPCGHRLCMPCEEKLSNCPVCRSHIRGRVFVMHS